MSLRSRGRWPSHLRFSRVRRRSGYRTRTGARYTKRALVGIGCARSCFCRNSKFEIRKMLGVRETDTDESDDDRSAPGDSWVFPIQTVDGAGEFIPPKLIGRQTRAHARRNPAPTDPHTRHHALPHQCRLRCFLTACRPCASHFVRQNEHVRSRQSTHFNLPQADQASRRQTLQLRAAIKAHDRTRPTQQPALNLCFEDNFHLSVAYA